MEEVNKRLKENGNGGKEKVGEKISNDKVPSNDKDEHGIITSTDSEKFWAVNRL